MGDVPFVNALETLVGNQFIAKHVAFFNSYSNTTFYSNPVDWSQDLTVREAKLQVVHSVIPELDINQA
ncbi:MAG: hypothetical protein RIK87_04205 [Fuerstiella sp.]